MNLFFKWTIGVVLVLCGLLLFSSYFQLAAVDKKRKYRIVKANKATRPETKPTVRYNNTTDKADSRMRNAKANFPSLEPPMIYLTYGYIEPFFNPPVIQTLLGHKCTTTTDFANMNRSDALVIRFSSAFTPNRFTKPQYRRQDQMYVYMSLEPSWPFHNHDFSYVDKDFFNWTMTYRRDSDIFFPYFTMHSLAVDEKQRKMFYGNTAVDQVLSRKTSQYTALVAIGRCGGGDGPIHRLKYVEALEKSGLRIEKRGGCYKNVFPHSWNSDAFRNYAGTFKFYLAFENGYHCRDYMTEKVWSNSLKAGAVPVIWGAPKRDVEKLIAPGSFIHTDDYKDPKQLVEYLRYLDSNATAYSQYFNWRRNEPNEASWKRDTSYKMLCNKLLEKKMFGNVSKTYHSFKDWFIKQDNPECFKITEANWL